MNAMWSRIRESRAGIVATVAVIAAVLLVPFGYTVHVRNETIRLENRVEAGASQVDTVIQKRLDSLNQLVRTAQESAQFESDAINRIIEARDKTASGDMEGANLAINAVAEQYPEMKSVTLFANVQSETSLVENQLNAARTANNVDVREYRNYVRQWPHSMVLYWQGYEEKPYQLFQATDGAKDYSPSSVWGDK